MTYVKLFGAILASTIWAEDDKTRLVWITMLAMADRDGVVQASCPGLAYFARVDVDACARALDILSSPDPDSRTKDFEGRRIQVVEGGWLILNYELHRDRATQEERREKDRLRQERKRKRDAERLSRNVTLGHESSRLPSESESASASASEVAGVRKKKTKQPSGGDGFLAFWGAYGKATDRKAALRVWDRIAPSEDLVAKIVAAAEAYAAATPDKAFRKHPATWLNGECWNNEIVMSNGASPPPNYVRDRMNAKHDPNTPVVQDI